MVSNLTELAGFALICVCLFMLAGVWAALVPVGCALMFAGYAMGDL